MTFTAERQLNQPRAIRLALHGMGRRTPIIKITHETNRSCSRDGTLENDVFGNLAILILAAIAPHFTVLILGILAIQPMPGEVWNFTCLERHAFESMKNLGCHEKRNSLGLTKLPGPLAGPR